MMWGQEELFSLATEKEVERTKFLLEKYKSMIMLIKDFEDFESELARVAIDGEAGRRIDEQDIHADKTSNAVILMEKQKWVYKQYCFYTSMLRRGVRLIKDEYAKKAIEYRFIDGYTRGETVSMLRRQGISDSTVDRRIDEGVNSIANTLKLLGFFENIQ